MTRKFIVTLGNPEEVCDYLTKNNIKEIYYRYGIWNNYDKIEYNEEKLYNSISGSPAGADLLERNGEYYVSVPTASDMW